MSHCYCYSLGIYLCQTGKALIEYKLGEMWGGQKLGVLNHQLGPRWEQPKYSSLDRADLPEALPWEICQNAHLIISPRRRWPSSLPGLMGNSTAARCWLAKDQTISLLQNSSQKWPHTRMWQEDMQLSACFVYLSNGAPWLVLPNF
jgi:hypothetical protein